MKTSIDTKQVIAKVAERHRILLRPDDPAFAIVTLNELMLEAMAAELIEEVNGSIREFRAAADRIQLRAGAAIAEEVRAATDSARAGLQADLEAGGLKARELVMEVNRVHSSNKFGHWFWAGLLCGLALLLTGVLLGKLL